MQKLIDYEKIETVDDVKALLYIFINSTAGVSNCGYSADKLKRVSIKDDEINKFGINHLISDEQWN